MTMMPSSRLSRRMHSDQGKTFPTHLKAFSYLMPYPLFLLKKGCAIDGAMTAPPVNYLLEQINDSLQVHNKNRPYCAVCALFICNFHSECVSNFLYLILEASTVINRCMYNGTVCTSKSSRSKFNLTR